MHTHAYRELLCYFWKSFTTVTNRRLVNTKVLHSNRTIKIFITNRSIQFGIITVTITEL